MNTLTSTHHPVPITIDPSVPHSTLHGKDPELKQLLSSTFSILEQSPPPTLREILGAYRTKGDGDRDMLLAMLNAKTAEDQRLASVAALQRSILEVYQTAPALSSQQPPARVTGSHHYPTPSFTHSPSLCAQKPRRAHQHHRVPSGSQSPPRVHDTYGLLPSMRLPHPESSRKRHRPSHSPASSHAVLYESYSCGSQHEQLPPSPYSSSGRSDSAEYSPRSRASMAIGSLLSSGPTKEVNTDDS